MCARQVSALIRVPFDLDILAPLTVMNPCVCSRVGVRKPEPSSTAGQNRAWKLTMSLPMKWCTSVVPTASGDQKSSKRNFPPASTRFLKLAM